MADLRRRQAHRRRARRAAERHLPAAAPVLPSSFREAGRLRPARRHHPHHIEGRGAGDGELPAPLRHHRRSPPGCAAHGRGGMERLDPCAGRRGCLGRDTADLDRGPAVAQLAIQLAARASSANGCQPPRPQWPESNGVCGGTFRGRPGRAPPGQTRRASPRHAQRAYACGHVRSRRRRLGAAARAFRRRAHSEHQGAVDRAARRRRCKRSSRPSRRWSGPRSPRA